MKFVSETSYVGPLDLVIDVLSSEELLHARKKAAGFPEDVEFARQPDGTHAFRIQVPAERIPGPARAFLPNGAKACASATPVVQTEAGRVHGAKIPYTIDVSGAPVSGELTILLADGGVTTPAKISGELSISIPFIGARLERIAMDHVESFVRNDTQVVNAEIARRRHGGSD